MPSAISAYYRISVSYDVVSSAAKANADVPPSPSNTTPGGDTVDISHTGTPSQTGATSRTGTSSSPSPTYGPPRVENRFHFAIANGMFDRHLRFSALTSRFDEIAVTTYSSRRDLAYQVTQTAGRGSVYAALFELQYRDAQPNPAEARSQLDARSEFNRMIDRNLSLLNSL